MGSQAVTTRSALLCAFALLALALPAWAAGDETAAQAQQPTAAPPAAAPAQPTLAAGLVAYIDPVTGGLTTEPTEEQRAAMRAALADALNYSDEGLVEVVLPDGSIMVDLQGRFQEAVVVRVNPDGTKRYEDVNAAAAAASLQAPAPAPQPTAAVTE